MLNGRTHFRQKNISCIPLTLSHWKFPKLAESKLLTSEKPNFARFHVRLNFYLKSSKNPTKHHKGKFWKAKEYGSNDLDYQSVSNLRQKWRNGPSFDEAKNELHENHQIKNLFLRMTGVWQFWLTIGHNRD